MNIDLDTFLTALYTTVDDLYQEHFAGLKPKRPGAKPRLSDSEVLTIVLCGQWTGNSERRMIRYAHEHWRGYFPRLLSQSQENRRARDMAGVLVHLGPLVARELRAQGAPYQIMDGVPVPLMRTCRGAQHRLFADEADKGIGGADKSYYYGCQLLLCVTDQGVITGFVLGPAATNIRWLADSLLCWRANPHWRPWEVEDLPSTHNRGKVKYVGPTGPIWPKDGVGDPITEPYIDDGGFFGAVWTAHWAADYQARVITPKSYLGDHAEEAKAQHRCWRHVIETVNSHLEGVFHLFFPLAHTTWGLLTRVAAKLAAFNLAIWLNRWLGRPDFAVGTLFNE